MENLGEKLTGWEYRNLWHELGRSCDEMKIRLAEVQEELENCDPCDPIITELKEREQLLQANIAELERRIEVYKQKEQESD